MKPFLILSLFCYISFGSSDPVGENEQEVELANISTCDTLPEIKHAKFGNGGNDTVGEVRNITCPLGFELKGNTTLKCGDSGQWLQSVYCSPISRIGETLIMCGDPPQVVNGTTGVPASYPINTVINVVCNDGFNVHGRNFIICTSNGLWTQPGTCEQGEIEPSLIFLFFPILVSLFFS